MANLVEPAVLFGGVTTRRFAIGVGWHRPLALELFQLGRELAVPVGTIFHDSEFETRPSVRLYREWQEIDFP